MAEVNKSIDQLEARVRELERIVAALATAPRATNTSVKGGSFTILDDSGNEVVVLDGNGLRVINTSGIVQARVGALSGGGYGVEVDNAAGTPISVNSTLFGASVGIQTGSMIPSASLANCTDAVITPLIGATGTMLLIAGAFVTLAFDVGLSSDVNLDVLRDGVALFPSGGHAGRFKTLNAPSSTFGAAASVVFSTLLAGMSPGVHTFQLQAKAVTGSANTNLVQDGFIIGFPL
jgi:hypothetical protein